VETSGKELSVASTTLVEASKWLLDPTDMVIESTGGTSLTGASVSASAIESNLATTDIELQADQDIKVYEDITWGEAIKLTLTAGDEIFVNATINNTNNTTGGVYFNAADTNAKVIFDASTGKVIVNNINQLQWINQALGGNYELGSNIDASDTTTWNSGAGFKELGDESTNNIDTQFTGNFDGKGYVVDGLFINRGSEYSVGLFGRTEGATISNIGLINVDITAYNGVGGLAGLTNLSTISNSYVTGAVSGNDNIGGLVGTNYDSSITNSYATADVTGRNNVGGLVGWNLSYSDITNSYATGAVSGVRNIGGLVGEHDEGSTITNSYATGAVSGNQDIGGLVGRNVSSTITNSYWDRDTTGTTIGVGTGSSTGTTGIYSSTNTVNAFNQITYAGFDFTNDWFMIEGETRPFLRHEYSTMITNDHQLQLMAMDLTADYTLANNITYSRDMWSAKGFDPIGDGTISFTGNFDGKGNVIDDLYINRGGEDRVGLFGYAFASNISNIGLTNVDITGKHYVGGLVGNNYSNITNSYATGTVSGNNYVGGLSGYIGDLLTNSYAAVTVTGDDYVGGLVGYLSGLDGGEITNSYATGTVSGNTNTGGLVGGSLAPTITNSYWDIDTTGQTNGTGGTGIYSSTNTVNAFNQATYGVFDFTNDWIIYEGHTRPLLRAFMTDLTVKANDATRTYDGTVYDGGSTGVTYSDSSYDSSLVNGTLNYTSSDDLKNAGTATVDVDGLYSSQQGYIISYDTGTLTTNKKDITVTGNSNITTYDGTAQSVNGFTASGLVGGETISVLDGVTGDSATATNAGTYNTNLSGTDENYNITFVDGSLDINKRALSLEASKDYDGTDDLTDHVTLGNLVGAETLEYTGAKANSSNPIANNFIKEIIIQDGDNGGVASNYELPSLLAYSVNNSVTIGDIPATQTQTTQTTPDLSKVITPIANQSVFTNKDIQTLLKSGIDIRTILQQLNTNELALIPGIVMKVLNGGINLPFGSKQKFNLDDGNTENEDDDKEKKLI
jgi:hypothetical protein